MNKYSKLSVILLFFMGVVSRLIPHVANFVPVFAIIAWFLFELKKTSAVLITFLMLFLSDVGLTLIKGYNLNGSWLLSNYICYAALFFIPIIKKQSQYSELIYGGVVFPLSFWAISNFLVWYVTNAYSKNIWGLILCFELALPFLFYSILANSLFSLGYKVNIANQFNKDVKL